MRRSLALVKRAARSPRTTLVVGVLLIVSSVFDLLDTAFEQMIGSEIGVGHGVIVWGLVEALKGLTSVLEDVTNVGEGLQELGEVSTETQQRA